MIKILLNNIDFYSRLKNDFTYHSSAIEGSTLTYEDNKLAVESQREINVGIFHNRYKRDELQENINCGVLFDYVVKTVDETLTERELKIWHNILKKDTQWSHDNNRSYGDYKKIPNSAGGVLTPQPYVIPKLMQDFFKDYYRVSKWTTDQLALFHCRFESIHAFLDGNGRIGRFILLKQCLQSNIDLFIVNNNSRNEYINSLKMYQQTNNSGFLSQYIKNLQKSFKVVYARFLNKQFNDNESRIIDYIESHGSITRKEVESLLGLSLSGAAKVIKGLITKNIIQPYNASRNTVYKLKQDL